VNAFRKYLVVILAIIGLTFLGTSSVVNAQEEGQPNVWNSQSCGGESALVFQERSETGDGVTVAVTDPWGCPEPLTDTQVLRMIEPWDGNGDRAAGFDQYNADAACYVNTYSEAGTFANRTGLGNLSLWVSDRASTESTPLWVHCSQVTSSQTLGVNPTENQVDPNRRQWVMNRAEQLLSAAGSSLQSYCASSTDRLAPWLCDGVSSAQPAADPEIPGAVPPPAGDGAQDGNQPTGQIFDPMAWLASPSFLGFVTNAGLLLLIALIILAISWWRNRNRDNGHGAAHASTNPTNHGQNPGVVQRTRNWFSRGEKHALSIKTDTLPAATAGQAYTHKVEVSDPSGAVIYSVSNAPSGLSIDGGGTISWPAPVQGTYVLRIKAQDDDETREKNLTLVVNAPAQQPLTAEDVLRIVHANQPAPQPAPTVDIDALAAAIAARQQPAPAPANPTPRRKTAKKATSDQE